ncbi:baculoviral IAP repeat-containing protein 2 isoform X1 [Biomphalaria glabrata]|nr:baculoviral IAP repeat-containing protein 2 isoform X1 [Biomphalaria glabrata]
MAEDVARLSLTIETQSQGQIEEDSKTLEDDNAQSLPNKKDFANCVPHHTHLNPILWSRLNEEKWRLTTFSNYPLRAAKSAILLAASGFGYTGNRSDSDDTVTCFFCFSTKNNWQLFDDVDEVHKKLSPTCPMVTKTKCTNVPFETLYSDTFVHHLKNSKPDRNNNSHSVSANIDPTTILGNTLRQTEPDGTTLTSSETQRTQGHGNVQQPSVIPTSSLLALSHNNAEQQNSSSLASSSIQQTLIASNREASASVATTTPHASVTTEISTASISGSSNIEVNTSPSSVSTNANAVHTNVTSGQSSTSTSSATLTQTVSAALGQTSEAAVTQAVSAAGQNSANRTEGGPTYSELGIVTERPKRFEYAVLPKRMETFTSWPRDHHLRPKELAEAGFYYAGYGDCARCFYCGGGLRNWEDEDDVWVEHARWFPKCAYIRQQMGQVFVDIVQELNKTYDHILFTMVKEKMGDAASAFQLDTKDTPLKRDPAVKTVVDMGFPYVEVIAAAEAIKNEGNILSADKIYDRLVSDNINRRPNAPKIMELKLDGVNTETLARDTERLRSLKEQNNQLRQQTVCKICMDKEVAVVFLPCGHLVSCTDCAAAMKDCPVCRNHVRGIVRAFMG